ncbi:Glutathione hydrolase-like YwrD proenzyme [Geodia barretti]|uniref:Glutathione hydrolase-like YwrD proenzyme n=1 Tax=Geodia barretti TaxID=519541 RepID=A0AA35WBL5_GEOBA|nr:Glutathione hydrolase-like YwrD proenzyme [Geodia barretti]
MYFDSRRSTVLATNGMVATSQPLAAMAGLQVLMDGGNATDAAITAAAALNVVEPNSTGVGGDLFALVWNEKEKSVRAINGSGRAAAASDIEELTSQGYRSMPGAGPYSVCVPGTVHGWETLRAECGTMPLSRLLEPAIRYAEGGFPVSEVIAWQWENNLPKLRMYPSGEEMMVDGNAPKKGDRVRFPTLATTLRAIAEGGCEAFYHGPIAEKMASFVQEHGGWLTVEDLAAHTSDWDEPIATDYRGVTCWECPPNGQGIAALEALNIAEGFDIAAMGAQSADAYHHLIEAMRLAFADAYRYVADPRVVDVPTEQLLSKEYAAQRRELMDPRKAMMTAPYGQPIPGGNTVYVSAGHLQLISNMVDHGMDPQQAINALRFMVGNDQALLEEGVSPDTARELQQRGHKLGLMAGRSRVSIGGARSSPATTAPACCRAAPNPARTAQ